MTRPSYCCSGRRVPAPARSFQAFHDYINLNNPDPAVPNDLIASELQSVASAERPVEDAALDVISGDFDGDNLDDYVAVWEGPNRSIEMIIPELDRQNLKWTNPPHRAWCRGGARPPRPGAWTRAQGPGAV